MTEASRYLSEYGDLSRLPLFSQPTNGATPAAAKLGSSGHRSPAGRPRCRLVRSSRSCALERPSS